MAPATSDLQAGWDAGAGSLAFGANVTTINPVAANQTLATTSTGGVFNVTLTQNTTLAITGPQANVACSLELRLTQDATGGRTVTWFPGITWLPGAAPLLPTGAGTMLIVNLESLDGGATWVGSYVGTASIEPWRVIGATGQPTFAGSWTNYGGTPPTLRFARDAEGVVRIEGGITATVSATFPASTIFTLPAGYRPAFRTERYQSVYIGGTTYAQSQVFINTDGTVVLNAVTSSMTSGTSELYLGLQFRAEQ